MIEITKEQYKYISDKIADPFVTVCSKRKRGSKGQRKSGKTYYCPESAEYLNALKKYNELGGVPNG